MFFPAVAETYIEKIFRLQVERLVGPGTDVFDLRVLWEKSFQILPLHHINFLSVKGFERLFERAGMTDVMVTTPGQQDVNIVRNALKRDPASLNGQRFIVERKMSSHVWAIGRRPSDNEISA